jgi:hypothetical protein
MKYIFIASLLSCAVHAAPFAQQGQQTQPQQAQQVGQQQGQQQQGATQQQGTQNAQGGQNGQNGRQNGQNGQANAPANGPQTGTGAGVANGQTPTAADLATAVANWMADTSMVSNFLNTGKSIQNNVAFKQAATVAFNAEVDELNHKAIIDAANGNQPNVIGANSTLATGGSFQDVVNKLQIMSQQGMAAVANIDLINQNRCVNGMFPLLQNLYRKLTRCQFFPTLMLTWLPRVRLLGLFARTSVTRLVWQEVCKV